MDYFAFKKNFSFTKGLSILPVILIIIYPATFFPASISFTDENWVDTSIYLENSKAYVMVVDPAANMNPSIPETVMVSLTAAYTSDMENITLTETGNNTSIFEGYIQLDRENPVVPGDGQLLTGNSGPPSWLFDTITASYGIETDTAQTTGSSTMFIDSYGADASSYAAGSMIYIRVVDYNANNPAVIDSFPVNIQSLTTGDAETIIMTETGMNTGIFRGSIKSEVNPVPAPDGRLQVQIGETIGATHMDFLGNSFSSDTSKVSPQILLMLQKSGNDSV